MGGDDPDQLDSIGYNIMDANATHDDAMTYLRNIYGVVETIYVNTHSLLLSKKTAGYN